MFQAAGYILFQYFTIDLPYSSNLVVVPPISMLTVAIFWPLIYFVVYVPSIARARKTYKDTGQLLFVTVGGES
jgi:hypothetical protein